MASVPPVNLGVESVESCVAFRPRWPCRTYEKWRRRGDEPPVRVLCHRGYAAAPVAPLPIRRPIKLRGDELTARQRQILCLLAQGCLSKEIGAHLGLTDRTVENHRENIRRATNLINLADLTRYALAQHWILNEFSARNGVAGSNAAASAGSGVE